MTYKHRLRTRTLSLLMVVLMLLSLAPLSAFAAEGDPTVVVGTGSALPGGTVSIDVALKNNPGVSTGSLKVTFDESILSLQAVTFGDDFADSTQPQTMASPVTLSWSELSDVCGDVTLVTLTFLVSDTAVEGTTDITLSGLDIINIDETPINFQVEDGSVEVVMGVPGDINGDGVRSAADLLRARKYFAGWNVEADMLALNANGDYDEIEYEKTGVKKDIVNSKDLLRLRKWFAGWDVDLWYGTYYSIRQTVHKLTSVAYKAPTCEEEGNIKYYYCTECGKYFCDAGGTEEISLADTVLQALGHDYSVFVEGRPVTTTETGIKDHHICSRCKKVNPEEQPIIIPIPRPTEAAISYNIVGDDTYLQSITIENPNPNVYTIGTELVLENLSVAGYRFDGWYTTEGDKITSIPASATEDYTLTAKWTKLSYSVQFNVSMIDPDQRDLLVINKNAEGTAKNEYTSDKAWVLPTLTMDTYTFVGWSDQYGNFYTDNVIPKGTSGDLILKDNWVSQRNRAVAKTTLDDPLIVEDLDEQIIYFAYEIGTIENVPLYTTQDLNCVNGIVTIVEKNVTHNITQEDMKLLGTSLTKETTDSTQFELSEEWTDTTQVSEEYLNETGKTREVAETEATSQSSTQSFNTSSGGTSQTYQYNDTRTKDETNTSYVVNKNLDTGMSTELTTNVKNTTELSAGLSFPVDIVDVNLGAKNTTEVSVGTDTKAYVDASIGTNASWDTSTYDESYQANSSTNSAYWNTDSGYTAAQNSSESTTVSNAVHELISESYGYGQTYSSTSGSSTLRGNTSATGSTTEEVASFTYTTQDIYSETVGLQTTGKTYGNYRMIMAGTLHAFAVVGYDVANQDFFVYTYYVMGDGTKNDGYKEIMDYSYDRSFADWESTVIPFSVPEYVLEYVNSRTTYTDGLKYTFDAANHTATVKGYTGTDKIVYVPSYMVDSEGTSYRVTGFTANAFQGKDIVAISLGRFITEIPEGAFKNCSSLEHVVCPRVISIGSEAFSGCTSLDTFEISKEITSIGENAFIDVPAVTATVSTASQAENIASSGAKSITLDISNVPTSDAVNLVVKSGDSLTILGGGKTFTNLTIESDAAATKLSKITLDVASGVPVKLKSESVTLYTVSIRNESGFGMELLGDATSLLLSGTNYINTVGGKALLCKAVNVVDYANSGELNVTGDIYNATENVEVTTVSDSDNCIAFTSADPAWKIVTITNDEFNLYLQGEITVTYDVNGGDELETSSKKTFRQTAIGELPTPTRDYYDFDGWFTEAEGGEEVTAESSFGGDTTIYAHWTANTCELTLDANYEGGTVEPATITTNVGGTVGELPTPTRDYYDFAGWFTEAEGGTEITAEMPVTDNVGYTIYAHWTQHETSDWVLVSEMPEDAELVDQKWTYTETLTTESTATSLAGYTQTGSYWVKSNQGSFQYSDKFSTYAPGFDTSNSIYQSLNKSPYTAYTNATTKREVENKWAGYVYWHWMYSCDANAYDRAIYYYNDWGSSSLTGNEYYYRTFNAFTSTTNFSGQTNENWGQNDTYYAWYYVTDRTSNSSTGGSYWFYRFDYYTCYYTDYYKMFQYKMVTDKESTEEVTASSTISNVQQWVQYRAK